MQGRSTIEALARLLGVASLFGAMACLSPSFAAAASRPAFLKDAKAFTARAAELFAQAAPQAKVTIKGPLTLSIDAPGAPAVATLDSAYSFCLRNPDDCERGLLSYVGKLAATFETPTAPPESSKLRAIVRPAGYVETYKKLYSRQGGPVAEPLVGDLWVLCALDLPGAVKIVSGDQLAALKLSREDALAACKQNIAAALPPLAPYKRDYPWPGVNIVTGDAYDASWMIFPDRWSNLAESVGGDLLVAAPGVNSIIYGSGRANDSVVALAKAAAFVAAQAEKPLSTAVFRWTPTGWEEARP